VKEYERELRQALSSAVTAGILRVEASNKDIESALQRAFPFEGSKIDWTKVRGHVGGANHAKSDAAFRDFFAARMKELGGAEAAFYLNDNLIDCVVRGSLFAFALHLEAILSMPAHHYFVAQDFSWCMTQTMEGDFDFGLSAAR
jgi:hypothetical protein